MKLFIHIKVFTVLATTAKLMFLPLSQSILSDAFATPCNTLSMPLEVYIRTAYILQQTLGKLVQNSATLKFKQ